MATITGTQIAASVRYLTQDTDANNYRDADADILRYLNEGARALCELVPAESLSTEKLALAAGAKQALPAKAISLVSVLRNMGVGGTTPGDAITPTTREVLDVFVPGWQNAAASSTIIHYMPDAKNPKVFHVYPPAVASTNVEVVLAAPPVEMTALTDVIKVNDTYSAALTNYVLFRLYSKDAEDAANGALAKGYYDAFRAGVGV